MPAEAAAVMRLHASEAFYGAIAALPSATGGAPGAGSCHDLLFSGTRESSYSRNVGTAPPGVSWLRAPAHRARRAPTHSQGPNGRFRSARKRAASTGRARRRAQPARGVPASSPLSAADLLHHVDLKIALGNEFLQLRVLGLELAQAFDVGGLQHPETAPPGVDRLGADLVLPCDLGNGCLIGLPQDRDHLLFSKTTLLHGLLAGKREPFSQVTIGPKNLGRSVFGFRLGLLSLG